MKKPVADVDAVLGLSVQVLQTLSPNEIPIVETLGVELIEQRNRSSDGALGFGEAEMSWVVAVVPVATIIGDLLLDAAKTAASDALKSWASQSLTRLRRRESRPLPSPPEGAADLIDAARRHAFEHAVALGMDDRRAALLADAVRGALAPSASASAGR